MIFVLVFFLDLLTPNKALANDWRPTQPISFIVMAGKDGGADRIARLIADLIRRDRLVPTEIKVRNLHTGSGGDALSYLKDNSGNEHLLLFTLNSLFSVPLTQPDRQLDIQTFSPIARLALDPFILWVHSERQDIKSIDDFVISADLEDWTMAGTGSNTEDELLTSFLNYHYRMNMRYQPLPGGGRVARLLSKRAVNSSVNNPSEILKYYAEKKVRPLAVFTRKRLPQFPDTPTFWEHGLKFEYLMQRGVAGPPGMSDEAVGFYASVFKRVFSSAQWQSFRKRNSLVGPFLSGQALRQYWNEQTLLHQQIFKVLGSLKLKADN
ncbi:MAG: Bug family tripartite tricarboxylate transporter substrate binding protein [Hyphomicrobiaceae bacterium]